MTLEDYLKNKRSLPALRYRDSCQQCRLSKAVCDCARLQPLTTQTEFVILMHPEESRRRIATGRMTHLMLSTSHLFTAESFESHPHVQALLTDRARDCAVLYPGREAIDIATVQPRSGGPRKRTIFVLDGTWRTAKKMLRLTPALTKLPQIYFTPPRPSTFRVRKQPKASCFSTLEAVHHMLGYYEPELSRRDHLIEMFDLMVERQIRYENEARSLRSGSGVAASL